MQSFACSLSGLPHLPHQRLGKKILLSVLLEAFQYESPGYYYGRQMVNSHWWNLAQVKKSHAAEVVGSLRKKEDDGEVKWRKVM